MGETQVFRFRDYELACGAASSDRGTFEPTLVVTRNTWPTRPRTIATQRGDHPNAQSAIDAAHSQGIEWITNYG
jgi:hypothetical protein